MSMVCPQCATSYEQRLQCPQCKVRLLYHDSPRPGRFPGLHPRWQHTPWGRIFIGILLSQGLFYGLRHLVTAGILAFKGEGALAETWLTLEGVVIVQALQVGSLLFGGLLAGSGQRNGPALGAVVGIWNGVFSVLAQQGPVPGLSAVTLYGQPLLHTAVGAVGGWVGCIVWKPLPSAAPGGSRLVRKLKVAGRKVSLFAGRVAWFRVAAGAALAVVGSLSATLVLELVAKASEGRLATAGDLTDRVVTWEIKALAVLIGGALAGSNTPNGLKQGLFVGLATALVLAGLEARFPDRWLEIAGMIAVSSLALSLVGGWFGSQLFPPVVPYKRRRGFGPASM
jgi:hypothetical protein